MQLFITPFSSSDDTITLTESRVVYQLQRVLRAKKGDRCCVQSPEGEWVRYQIELNKITKKEIEAQIVHRYERENVGSCTSSMYVALPNKPAKVELIAQKLTEVGVEKIFFWPATRSVLSSLSTNRHKRVEKIILEASEQSWRWTVPELCVVTQLPARDSSRAILSQGGKHISWLHLAKSSLFHGLVGPEGGFSDEELQSFEQQWVATLSLWMTTLRMETAAIVAWWRLVSTTGLAKMDCAAWGS
jgi:16S rRNA (uracil1498-N3)-methyltransferase